MLESLYPLAMDAPTIVALTSAIVAVVGAIGAAVVAVVGALRGTAAQTQAQSNESRIVGLRQSRDVHDQQLTALGQQVGAASAKADAALLASPPAPCPPSSSGPKP